MLFSCPVPGRFLLVSTGHLEMGSLCWDRVGTRQEELGSWCWERGDRVESTRNEVLFVREGLGVEREVIEY